MVQNFEFQLKSEDEYFFIGDWLASMRVDFMRVIVSWLPVLMESRDTQFLAEDGAKKIYSLHEYTQSRINWKK